VRYSVTGALVARVEVFFEKLTYVLQGTILMSGGPDTSHGFDRLRNFVLTRTTASQPNMSAFVKESQPNMSSFLSGRISNNHSSSNSNHSNSNNSEVEEGDDDKEKDEEVGRGLAAHDAPPPSPACATGDDMMIMMTMMEQKANEKSTRRCAKTNKYGIEDDDDDAHDDGDIVVLAEEATIPVVDAAYAPVTTARTGHNDLLANRLRAAERRALQAEAARRAADEERKRLSAPGGGQWLQQTIAKMSRRQWRVWLTGLGMVFALAVATIGVCEAPASGITCGRRRSSSKNNREDPPPAAATFPPTAAAHPGRVYCRLHQQYYVDRSNIIVSRPYQSRRPGSGVAD
jgi:hypothetical protein